MLQDAMHVTEAIRAEELALLQDAKRLGIEPTGRISTEVIHEAIEGCRKGISALERGTAVLEASRALDQVATLERDLSAVQEDAAGLEKQRERIRKAEGRSKAALDVVRRIANEIVDERLAQLSPLLEELYRRLRPHTEWSEVSYRIRGDVRRFLSLEVGDGLNPRFMFSSGQRRAVGLAFLLAVYLSRSWCLLRTLVLDDPIQHIDDFRALHLVEVLSGIRQRNQQVICTVEDPAVAELLCRRLRSTEGAEGAMVNLEYALGEGVRVESIQEVKPLLTSALLSA
jgi:DNA repair exonuclease SbcCD ATPase subunit